MADTWYVDRLPTLEEMRVETRRLVSEAQDTARSDWLPGTGLDYHGHAAAEAWREARDHLARAKESLDTMSGAMQHEEGSWS